MLSERELASRVEINWERYVKVVNIEANCALDIASTMILPATARYLGQLARRRRRKGINAICEKVAGLADSLVDAIDALEHAQHEAHEAGSVQAEATAFSTEVIPAQAALRDGRRRARDARRGRPLAAAEVPRAALPVLRAAHGRTRGPPVPSSWRGTRGRTPSSIRL